MCRYFAHMMASLRNEFVPSANNTGHGIRNTYEDKWYNGRNVLFKAFTNHLYPLLSQQRHYMTTLEDISLHVYLHMTEKNEWRFLGQLLTKMALLPKLARLDVKVASRLELKDFQTWNLVGFVSFFQNVASTGICVHVL